MRTPEQVAADCVYSMHKREISRDVFEAILRDDREMGQNLRKLVAAITKAVATDRVQVEAAVVARLAGAK